MTSIFQIELSYWFFVLSDIINWKACFANEFIDTGKSKLDLVQQSKLDNNKVRSKLSCYISKITDMLFVYKDIFYIKRNKVKLYGKCI